MATLKCVAHPSSHASIDDVMARNAAKENIYVWSRHKILSVSLLYFSLADGLQLDVVDMASNPLCTKLEHESIQTAEICRNFCS